jgi:F-type H+-transporting ATPase subunit delta
MKDLSVAERYARALFLVTEKRRETARVLEDLKALVPVLGPGARIRGYLASPEVRLADKRGALGDALEGRVLPLVAVFVDLLLRKKRLGLFERATVEFEALVERSQGIHRAHVVSAAPLSSDETGRLLAALEKRLAGKVRLTASVDPALLGGATVRIGDRVLDRSVHTLLAAISHQLYQASV